MKLDYNLKLEQTQKLIITPELKLAITLLQYSALELQDHIQ
ncbi:MAG: RNA polymerase subunit sigma-54, partial [Dethiobacteria bacterium]